MDRPYDIIYKAEGIQCSIDTEKKNSHNMLSHLNKARLLFQLFKYTRLLGRSLKALKNFEKAVK